MVATKRNPSLVEVNPKERKGIIEGGPGAIEPLGGFIFVCNNDTMAEDLERHLFGLPQRYQDSVKAIQPGLPLFLYNYSTRCLHGVFEASSDGGLNIEPEAWETKELQKNGRQVSRFPAQVRVRTREERPPLDEEKFRPLLYHYDGPKFRLELSVDEAEDLLKLFGTSSTQKLEKVQDEFGGEWEKVKSKSKVTRVHRPPPTKRSGSPNPPAGRRRAGSLPSSSTSNNTSQSAVSSSANGSYGRGRESRADLAQRWRSDSDSWSGSSSAGISSSSWASHDEDRPKKGMKENGVVYMEANSVGIVSEFHDQHDAIALKSYEHTNGSCENGSERDSRADSDELNTELNGLRSSPRADSQQGSQSPSRPGFASYSAALKAGMIGFSADSSNGDIINSNGVGECGTTAVSRVSLSGNGALPSNASEDLVTDGMRIGAEKIVESGVSIRTLNHPEGLVSGMQPILGSYNVGEQGRHERTEGNSVLGEGEGKKVDNRKAWCDRKSTLAARLAVAEDVGRISLSEGEHIGRITEGEYPPGKPFLDNVSTSGYKSAKNVSRPVEGERGDMRNLNHRTRSVRKETLDVGNLNMDIAGKNGLQQGDDAAALLRLHDPVTSSTPLASVVSGQHGPAFPDTADGNLNVGLTMSPASQALLMAGQNVGQVGSSVSDVQQNVRQAEHFSGVNLPAVVFPSRPGQHTNAHLQGPLPQPALSAHDLRRGQQSDYGKERDEKMQHHRTQSPSPDLVSSVIHHRPAGQSLVPLRIPTPPPQSQQHFHHSSLSPAVSNAQYRDRRSRSGAVDVGPHGMAYRPVNRGPLDGDLLLQNGVVVGGGRIPSPTPMMLPVSPLVNDGTFALPPPQLLVNAEELHFEILEFARAASPSAEARMCAEAAVDCVRDAVKKLWPSADVEVFGSYATGLCLSHSDVDVVVVNAPPPPETAETASLFGARVLAPLIRLLGTTLRVNDWCEDITTIESATMPVIKLHCKPPVSSLDKASAPPSVVKIDITIGGRKTESLEANATECSETPGINRQAVSSKFEAASKIHNGVATREYVIERLLQQPALAPLVLLLKSYLQLKGLKDVYTGGLGSFSLTIMLVFYLERVPLSCGMPQEATYQVSSSAPVSTASSDQPSADTTVLASAPSCIDTLDSHDEGSCCSSASIDTASVSIQTSESSSITSEDSSENGMAAAVPLRSMETGNWEPHIRCTGGIVEQLLASMHTVPSPNLGTLLIGFLHTFGREIDLTQVRLVTKGNGGSGGLFYHVRITRPVALTIDDPLRPGSNIGAGSFNMFQVQMAMQEMLHILIRPSPVANPERAGMDLGKSHMLPLLDQLFMNPSTSPAP